MAQFQPNQLQPNQFQPDQSSENASIRSTLGQMDSTATANRVNRTHRVVRERARTLKDRRSRIRSLYVPLAIFSTLLIAICTAVWSIFDQYEIEPNGNPVASAQIFVFLLWSVPVSAALMAIIWFRQSRAAAEGGFGE